MQSFNEEELEQVNKCLRGTVQNLKIELAAKDVDIADLKQRLECAEKFFAAMTPHELANISTRLERQSHTLITKG